MTAINNSKPGFLVVGGEKCGTTTLYSYLRQHPDICIPDIKECRYFSDMGERVLNPFTGEQFEKITRYEEEYKQLFQDCGDRLCGDVSPDYLYEYEVSISNILKLLGNDIKIIIMLRDPVERAYSNYLHLRREHLTEVEFKEYLALEEKFDESTTWWGFYTKKAGLYAKAVAGYMDVFNSVKIIYFESFIEDPKGVVCEVFDYLGVSRSVSLVDPAFTNKTGLHKSRIIEKILSQKWFGKKLVKKCLKRVMGEKKFIDTTGAIKSINLYKPTMSSEVREYLEHYYRDDKECLRQLLGTEASWLKKP